VATITVEQICDAIAATLGAAAGINRTQSFDEVTEDYPNADLPMLQVYPQGNEVDARSESDRHTFRAGSRINIMRFVADVVCRQRSHIGLDIAKQVEMWEAVETVLYAQTTKPYFALAGIKGFHWTTDLVWLQKGDPAIHYAAVRFTVTIEVF